LAVLLAGGDLMLRDAGELRAEAVMARHTVIAGEIDRHLGRLERDRISGYRPASPRAATQPVSRCTRIPGWSIS
jgi:hypothetical protein